MAELAEPCSPRGQPKETVRALLIVDIQVDFITGSLAVPDAHSIIPVVNKLRSKKFDYVYVCQDYHPFNHCSFRTNNPGSNLFEVISLPCTGNAQIMWPDHCVQGTEGAQLHKDVLTESSDIWTFAGCNPQRDSYSVFKDNGSAVLTEMRDLLEQNKVTEIYAVGLATEYCVQYTLLDAKILLHGVEVYCIDDGCRGINDADIMSAFKTFEFEKVHVIKSDGPEIGMIEDRKVNLGGWEMSKPKIEGEDEAILALVDDVYESLVLTTSELDTEKLKQLIANGTVNRLCSWSGKNILHAAAETGNIKILEMLIGLGNKIVDLNACSDKHENVLMFAAKCRVSDAKLPMIRLILDSARDLGTGELTDLMYAQTNRAQMSTLMFACRDGDADTVEVLLKYNNTMKFLQMTSTFGKSALMYACTKSLDVHAEIVEMILKARPGVVERLQLISQRDDEGWNALHFTAKSGCFAVVDWARALDNYTNVARLPINVLTNSGISFLHLAAFNGKSEVIRAILESVVKKRKKMLLQNVLKKDLRHKIEVNVKVRSTGDSELDLALQRRHLECARLLLRLGCHAGTSSAQAMHELLHRLVLMGDVEACESLLNYSDENGITIDQTLVEITERMEHPETCTFSFAGYANPVTQFLYKCEYCDSRVCLVCRDRCHGPETCRKGLINLDLEHFPDKGWTSCGSVETHCACKRESCCATAATDTREVEGYRFLPNPISTSAVELPKALTQLCRKLARNQHNLWAESRYKDGWKYGADKVEREKTHPYLLPFSYLTQEGIKYNMDSCVETLKVIVALNYDIELVDRLPEAFTPRRRLSGDEGGGKPGEESDAATTTEKASTQEEEIEEKKEEERQAKVSTSSILGVFRGSSSRDKNREKSKSVDKFPETSLSPRKKDKRRSIKFAEVQWRPDERECQPVDTSSLHFPSELTSLVELLAANSHEVWADEKLRHGWRFAPERNIKKGLKLNSSLVPYHVLTEEEKEELRHNAREIIKLCLHYGYRFSLGENAFSFNDQIGKQVGGEGETDGVLGSQKRRHAVESKRKIGENRRNLAFHQLKHIRRKLFNQYLFAAVRRGQINSVDILLAKKSNMHTGANVNAIDEYGHTPLYIAVKRGHINTTKRLLQLGANVELRDINGLTPLAIAAYLGNLELCQVLVLNQATILVNDNFGFTPLHHAANEGNLKVCTYLTERLQQERQVDDIVNLNSETALALLNHENSSGVPANPESRIAKKTSGSKSAMIGEPTGVAVSGLNVFRALVSSTMLGKSKSQHKIIPESLEVSPRLSPRLSGIKDSSSLPSTPRFSQLSTGSDEILNRRINEQNNIELNLSSFSPLSLAVCSDNIDVVEMLIKHGGNPMQADGVKEEGSLFSPYVRALFRHIEVLSRVEDLRRLIQEEADLLSGKDSDTDGNFVNKALKFKKVQKLLGHKQPSLRGKLLEQGTPSNDDESVKKAERVLDSMMSRPAGVSHEATGKPALTVEPNAPQRKGVIELMTPFNKGIRRADSKLGNFFGFNKANREESGQRKSMRELDAMLEVAREELESASRMVGVLNTSKTVRSWREKCAVKMFVKETTMLLLMLVTFGVVVQLAPDYNLNQEREWAERLHTFFAGDSQTLLQPELFLGYVENNLFDDVLRRNGNVTTALGHNIVIGGVLLQKHEHFALRTNYRDGIEHHWNHYVSPDLDANVTDLILPQTDLMASRAILHNVTKAWLETGIQKLMLEISLYNPYFEVYGLVTIEQSVSFYGDVSLEVSVKPFRLGYGRFPPSRVFQFVIVGNFLFFSMTKLRNHLSGRKNGGRSTKVVYSDWLSAMLLGSLLIFDLYVYEVSRDIIPGDVITSDYSDLGHIHSLLIAERRVIAVYLFLSMIPLLSAARTIPNVGPVVVALLNTMTHKAVRIYVAVFATACGLLSLTFHVGYGGSVEAFSTTPGTFNNLFLTPFIESWDLITAASGVLGKAFSVFYILFATITLNLLIAIVTDVYPNARSDSDTLWEHIITAGIENNLRAVDANGDSLKIKYWDRSLLLSGKDGVKHWKPENDVVESSSERNNERLAEMEAQIVDLTRYIKTLLEPKEDKTDMEN